MKKQKGFTLIELLIVVAIILIIAAIAIPNLLRSRMAANEASAVGSLRTINTAEITYSSTYGTGFTSLAALGTSNILDQVVAGGTKSGYTLTGAPAGGTGTQLDPYTQFLTTGDPVTAGRTGIRHFCSDESGVIRFDPAAAIVCGPGTTALPLQ